MENYTINGQCIIDAFNNILIHLNKSKFHHEAITYSLYVLKAHAHMERLRGLSKALHNGDLTSHDWFDSHKALIPECEYYAAQRNNAETAERVAKEVAYRATKAFYIASYQDAANLSAHLNLLYLAQKAYMCYIDGVFTATPQSIKELLKNMKKAKRVLHIKKKSKIDGYYEDFDYTIDNAKEYIRNLPQNKNDAVLQLTYIIKVLLYDIQATALCKTLDKAHWAGLDSLSLPLLPTSDEYYTQKGNSNFVQYTLDFSKDIIIVGSDDRKNQCDLINKITAEGFEFREEHKSVYYTDLDFAQVTTGFHSQTAGFLSRKGEIRPNAVYDMEKAYPLLKTHEYDRKYYWQNAQTGEVLHEISDPRIALLYEAGRIRWNLKNQLAKDDG